MEYKTLRERIEEQAVSNNDLSQKEIDRFGGYIADFKRIKR